MPAPDLLERYADLTVRVGVNLRPGQELLITAFPEHLPLARALSNAAWKAGAGYVDVSYRDQHVKRDMIEYGPEDALEHTPDWIVTQYERLAATSGALIQITGNPAPELFAGLDETRIGKARMRKLGSINQRIVGEALISWSIVSFPTEGWATTVFGQPDVERLWEAVATAVRLDDPDPVAAWRAHMDKLRRRADSLNALALVGVHYSGPGTDLTVGLNPASVWKAAEFETAFGTKHIPNLPTEEVFTTPDWRRAEGVVRSTRPLSLPGQSLVVRDLELELEGGRVVDVRASTGAEVIRTQLETDDGASRLGELALVDGDSAVGKTGVTFWDTLFDENATSHIAYGHGITFCVEGARGLSDKDRLELGVNDSIVHTDFMVGGPEVEIDGLTADGRAIPLLRDDVWQPA